jgi:hypothetical protein
MRPASASERSHFEGTRSRRAMNRNGIKTGVVSIPQL